MLTRPRDITSSVASCLASSTAGRSGAISTPVESRIRRVAPAIAASTVSGSNQGEVEPGRKPAVGVLVEILAHYHVIGEAHLIDARFVRRSREVNDRCEIATEPLLQAIEADCYLYHDGKDSLLRGQSL